MEHSKYGDDFNVGDVYTTAAITVTETHVVNWAGLTMDFYPLHVDKEYAAGTQFGHRLVHGPLIFGVAVGLVSKEGFAGDAAVAWFPRHPYSSTYRNKAGLWMKAHKQRTTYHWKEA